MRFDLGIDHTRNYTPGIKQRQLTVGSHAEGVISNNFKVTAQKKINT